MKTSFTLAIIIMIVLMAAVPSVQAEYPTDMVYRYEWYSYWCGSSSLEVTFVDGDAHFDYDVQSSGECESVEPFQNSFSFEKTNFYSDISDLFFSDVNVSDIFNWATVRYRGDIATCDGGGFNSILTMNFDGETHIVENIIDNDSCSGTRTNKSNPEISIQLEFIHNLTIEEIENEDLHTGTLLPISYALTILPLFILPFLRKKLSRENM